MIYLLYDVFNATQQVVNTRHDNSLLYDLLTSGYTLIGYAETYEGISALWETITTHEWTECDPW